MLGQQIRNLRISNGMTQTQLAFRLGVVKQSVGNWETDNIMPSVEMLVKIADLFQVSADYLLDREDYENKGLQYIDVTGLSDDEIEHVRMIVEDIRK